MTHSQAERSATEELARAGYVAYLPLIAVRRQDPVIRSMFRKVRVPMFPGYGFVYLSPADAWGPIRRLPGVRDMLLNADGRPGSVPSGLVEALKAGDAERCDLAIETLPVHRKGSPVRISEGALSDFGGSVLECDGMHTLVEVEIFGRPVPVRLDRAIVVAA